MVPVRCQAVQSDSRVRWSTSNPEPGLREAKCEVSKPGVAAGGKNTSRPPFVRRRAPNQWTIGFARLGWRRASAAKPEDALPGGYRAERVGRRADRQHPGLPSRKAIPTSPQSHPNRPLPNDSEFCWRGPSGVKAQTFRSSDLGRLLTPKRAQTSAAQNC